MFLALEFSNDRRTAGVMGSPGDDFYHFFLRMVISRSGIGFRVCKRESFVATNEREIFRKRGRNDYAIERVGVMQRQLQQA